MLARWVVVLVLAAGCKAKDDPFQADVKLFCEAATKHPEARTLMELAPTFAEGLKTNEFRDLFTILRGGSLDDFEQKIREAMKKANVDSCPTLEVLLGHVRQRMR
jgi:hypothetical protein